MKDLAIELFKRKVVKFEHIGHRYSTAIALYFIESMRDYRYLFAKGIISSYCLGSDWIEQVPTRYRKEFTEDERIDYEAKVMQIDYLFANEKTFMLDDI